MKSVCIFVHYGVSSRLPYPEEIYVKELTTHFSEVVLVTNLREFAIGDLPENVSLKLVKNEGYDFGMFYKVALELDWANLDRLALANDSNLMIQSLHTLFERGEKLNAHFWGAVDSFEKPWFSTHADNYHLQSHFLVWEKPSIPLLKAYLDQVSIQDFFGERDPKNLRRKVINDWEIGLSQYFLKNNSIIGAAFSADQLPSSSGKNSNCRANITFDSPRELLQLGYPFLKKRILNQQKFLQRIFFPNREWETLVSQYGLDTEHVNQMILYIKNKRRFWKTKL